ncbi:hypothetical protein ACOMHN_062411 [Nucella lapillus]
MDKGAGYWGSVVTIWTAVAGSVTDLSQWAIEQLQNGGGGNGHMLGQQTSGVVAWTGLVLLNGLVWCCLDWSGVVEWSGLVLLPGLVWCC